MIRIMLPEQTHGLQARIAELEAENSELRRRLADPAMDPGAPAEATLRESEANWRSLVESIPEFLMLLDPNGVIRWINRAAPAHRPEELIGLNVLQFATPDTRPIVEQAFRTALETGQTVDYVCESEVEGERVCYHGRTTLLTDARTPGQMLTIARDITEQLRTEERLRMLEAAVVHAPEAILVTEAEPLDEPGPRILYVNPAFTTMTGYTADEALGRSPRFLQGRETAPAAQAAIRTALKTRQPVSVEIVNYRKTGQPFWVELSITPITNAAGNSTHFVSVQRDLTERKRAEEESRRMQCKLQETQKLESLGVLAGGVAHDFNNLLTVILGNTSLARMHTPEQATAQAYFDQIDQAAMRAGDLCRQMLAYSGRGRFVVMPLDLSALVRESSSLLRSAVSKKTTLRLNIVENLPAVVADAVQLRQILMNLVLNASEALDEQPGTVVVETGVMHADTDYLAATRSFTDLSEGKYVFLEVRDSGCGMTPEVQERIFDPFYTTKFTGRGLGLAAVLGIVRGHGGALRVNSEAGVGTRFRLLLPPSEAPAVDRSVEAPKSQWRGEGVVLVVDDEDAVRTLVARMLNSIGFEVLEAADGQAAVEVYTREAGRIRLVLLDLMMPRLDGAQTLQGMRRVCQDVRAIVMSGYTEYEMSQRFASAPPAGFLQKPFVREQLFSLVARVLEV
jgi:PAS domain S-box-containing protein